MSPSMAICDESEAVCAGRSSGWLDSSDESDSSDETTRYAAVACILLRRGQRGAADPLAAPAWERAEEDVLRLCQRVAARVELLPLTPLGSGALLDLGRCSSLEARSVCTQALAELAQRGFAACAGVGATVTIAQLAALTARTGAVRVIVPAQVERFLQQTPVAALASLRATDATNSTRITGEVVARLRRYGLQTLGQVARLDRRDPQALRRQFGNTVGAGLAALAQGGDLRPLRPTSAPAAVSARLRCAAGLTYDQALATLPALAERLAQRLAAQERQGRDLRLRIVWESGGVTRGQRRLARPLSQPRELAQAVRSLLTTLLAPSGATPDARADTPVVAAGDARACDAVLVALTVRLGDLSAQRPAQASSLWEAPDVRSAQGAQQGSAQAKRLDHRLERITREVAEPLARRYGRPALYRLTTSQPDAILPEERAHFVRLTLAQSDQRPRPATARTPGLPSGQTSGRTRAPGALEGGAAGGARPPEPHWW